MDQRTPDSEIAPQISHSILPNNQTLAEFLRHDNKVKVAGVDCDGILRGKIMSVEKFLSTAEKGFGMSSAIFGWDMHDELYAYETNVTSLQSGYADFTAFPDLKTFRRVPWEDNIPFFLLRFVSNDKPVHADGRSMLRNISQRLESKGWQGLAGVELEFMNFQTPSQDGYESSASHKNLGAFLASNSPSSLRQLTSGMFGYSVLRPTANKDYFYNIFDTSRQFRCDIEGWHTESGPGVFEAALAMNQVAEIADRVSLFKLLTKSVGIEHNATPCFMAKPIHGLPGNSGHIHISLCTADGQNLFARESEDTGAAWSDIAHLSDIGRFFLAGILNALPDIMPLFAPTINSYKRLVENYWAPINISWGLEDRLASIRLIAPPVSSAKATRFEIRIPGADLHPHYALASIVAAGLHGIEQKLDILVPPNSARQDTPTPLPNTLEHAVQRFRSPASIARKLFSDEFVDFFSTTRDHELKLWREAVTDWEFKRYIETV
ncbi:glutamine synthetase/guanido kinase [Aaosphaeria arxii CBS 175.79]|uniref:Glutamine synthetase n=1 Tax=Aaosphaeria arxii CBS 175.79 TaxID=1450172 RepID=A0A6A5XD23_9PLEO|nr:glutamine synthetase/guanido kinase [Aaosphaeria arxii CBS 175.79]KAF2010902.1 glutamine synthetase/guanido kinase [Aaosphaeria arxii CBS 175.79]